MPVIYLNHQHLESIIHHAQQDAPNETCGLLLGQGCMVTEILPVANVSRTPMIHYEIEPKTIAQHLDQIIGFYHSHPKGTAIPSQTDIRSAWPNTVYCIVGLTHTQPQIGAWMMNYGEVSPVEILSQKQDTMAQAEPVNRSQAITIIISAVLAFVIFMIVSISLLPPAPVIPS